MTYARRFKDDWCGFGMTKGLTENNTRKVEGTKKARRDE